MNRPSPVRTDGPRSLNRAVPEADKRARNQRPRASVEPAMRRAPSAPGNARSASPISRGTKQAARLLFPRWGSPRLCPRLSRSLRSPPRRPPERSSQAPTLGERQERSDGEGATRLAAHVGPRRSTAARRSHLAPFDPLPEILASLSCSLIAAAVSSCRSCARRASRFTSSR